MDFDSTFVGGLNSMAVIMVGVLTKRGLTKDQAVLIANDCLDIARRQMAGEQVVTISGDAVRHEARIAALAQKLQASKDQNELLRALIQSMHQHYNPGAEPFDIEAGLAALS